MPIYVYKITVIEKGYKYERIRLEDMGIKEKCNYDL